MTTKTEVPFTADDLAPVLNAIDRAGWVNLQPDVEDPPPDPRPGWFGSVFSNRGPGLPIATWHPGERSAGVQHPTTKKVDRTEVPAGWAIKQNHPRRGLVVQVPAEVSDVDVVRWLVDLGEKLSPIPTHGKWRAVVFSP
jgi:hypothetical protein